MTSSLVSDENNRKLALRHTLGDNFTRDLRGFQDDCDVITKATPLWELHVDWLLWLTKAKVIFHAWMCKFSSSSHNKSSLFWYLNLFNTFLWNFISWSLQIFKSLESTFTSSQKSACLHRPESVCKWRRVFNAGSCGHMTSVLEGSSNIFSQSNGR